MPPETPDAPRILVVRFSSLGDLILITPLLRSIRQRHPRAHVTLVTRAEYASLFVQNPRVDELVTWDGREPLTGLIAKLRTTRWTHRLDLHGSLRSRWIRFRLGGVWGGYPKHRRARMTLIKRKRDVYRDRRHVVERYFDAARGLEVVPDDKPAEIFFHNDALRAADQFLREAGVGLDRTLVAVVPGASHATKRWPEEYWHQLVTTLVATGRDVVVLGGRQEEAIGRRLADTGGARTVSAAGLFDLQGTAALLKRSRGVAVGDTGLMHLATAVGTPAVVLLGPTVAQFGFTPYRARATILERQLDCRPCSAHGGEQCPLGHHRCLVDILPDEVADAFRRLPQ